MTSAGNLVLLPPLCGKAAPLTGNRCRVNSMRLAPNVVSTVAAEIVSIMSFSLKVGIDAADAAHRSANVLKASRQPTGTWLSAFVRAVCRRHFAGSTAFASSGTGRNGSCRVVREFATGPKVR